MSDDLARAEHLIGLGRYAEARTLARSVLAGAPDDLAALELLVAACLPLRDRTALPAAQAVVRMCPDDSRPLVLAAQAAAVQGRDGLARRYADAAVAMEPDSVATRYVRAWIELLGWASTAGVASARAAVRLDPQDPDTHRVLGALLLKRGKHDDAEVCLRAALAIDPTHEAALDDLGRLGLERMQPIEAARRFADALALDPGDTRTAHNTMVALGRPIATVHTLLVLPALWFLLHRGPTSDTLAAYVGVVSVMVLAATMAKSMVRRLPTSGGRLFATTLRRDRLLVLLGIVLTAAYAVLYTVPIAPDPLADRVVSVFLWLVLAVATAVRMLRLMLGRSRARPLL